jgi:hypothetical protein
MLRIRNEQLAALADAHKRALEAEADAYLRARFPELPAEEQTAIIASGRDKALLYGINRPDDVHRFLALMVRLGRDFDRAVRTPAWRILRNGNLPAAEQLDLIDRESPWL